MSSAAEPGRAGLRFLVPCFEGLSPALADLTGLLPIRAANASLLRAVDADRPAPTPTVAGVLSVDPFLNGAALYRALAARGIRGVVNLPSVAPADGALQGALAVAGLDAAHEIRALASAREHGLEPVALVFSREAARRAADAGVRRVLLHPGLPTGDGPRDRALAEAATLTLGRLRADGYDALLYRHPDLSPWLPGSGGDRGQLTWRIGPSRAPQRRP